MAAAAAASTPPEIPKEFTVLTKVQVPSFRPGRAGKQDVQITYRTPDMNVYLIYIPAEDFSEKVMVETIRKQIESDYQIIGRTFKIT
jgi:hypothetical protein